MNWLLKSFRKIFRPIERLYVAYDSGDKNKPTIVLLHGIAATSKTWLPLIKEIDADKYRIIALDLLGFGKSPKPNNCDYSVNDHVDYIYKTLKKLKINKPYRIIGHSMGSIIAAQYCLRHQKDVKDVYLLSLPLYFTNSELHTNLTRTYTDMYLKAYDYISQNKKFTILHSRRLRKLLSIDDGIEVNEDNWNSFKLSLRNTIINQNTYDDVSKLKLPVTIFYGNLDEFVVTQNINKLADFNNVKIIKIKIVDHSVGSRFSKIVANHMIDYDNRSY